MNNETDKMPETIWINSRSVTWENGRSKDLPFVCNPDAKGATEYHHHTDKTTEVQRQNAALKSFVTKIIKEQAWEISDEMDGGDVQGKAEDLGIIIPHTVTEEDQREEGAKVSRFDHDYQPGDNIFIFPDWMLTDAAMPQPSKAQIAREFAEVLAIRVAEGTEILTAMVGLLQEWEAAEEKA